MISPPIEFNVSGVEFITASLAAAAEFFWLPTARLRQLVWAAGAGLALWVLVPNGASLTVLSLFVVSGYLAARAAQARPSRGLLAGYLSVLVASFLVLKQYGALDWIMPRALLHSPLLSLVRVTGLSYMLFRQIHVLVDASEGQIENLSLWTYLNYQLNPFTILAGPIQRYQDFAGQWARLEPVLEGRAELLDNGRRLLWGVVKVGLIAPFFFEGWNELQGTMLHTRLYTWKYVAQFPVVLYFYPVYLYCNFSGYCDIVIALARFLGMRLPENFDRPWLARDVIEYWTRWHITLGTWIRDYLFMPIYKPMVEKWPAKARSLVWIAYFAAFAVAGAWHGTTMNFFLYGVLQGVGISINKVYENWIVRRWGRDGLQRYLRSRAARAAAVFLNFQFQCALLLVFSQRDVGATWRLVHGLARVLRGNLICARF